MTAASGYSDGLNFAQSNADFEYPEAIAVDSAGNVFVANDSSPGSLIELTAASDHTTALTFARAGAGFFMPFSVAIDAGAMSS